MKTACRAALLAMLVPLASCTAVIDQSSFFPPDLPPPAATLAAPPGYRMEDALMPLPGLGQVHVVRLDDPASDRTLIYSGGNGSFVADASARARALADATGADIILYDYPGRGGTTVPPTIDASIAFGPAFVAALRERGWIGGGGLYAYGFSFGGAQAAAMARDGGFDGLVIEGSAPDIARVGSNFIPTLLRPFVRLRVSPDLARFDYLGYTVSAGAPVLLIAADEDRIVTARNMRDFLHALSDRSVPSELIEVEGGHGAGLCAKSARVLIARYTGRKDGRDPEAAPPGCG